MSLKDFLAKQPIDVIVKTKIRDKSVHIPVDIDPRAFYKTFNKEIDTNGLSSEKAVYIGAMQEVKPMITSYQLLTSKLHFG